MAKIIATHYVRSRSNQSVVHKIEVWDDGWITCSCLSFAYRRKCAHVDYIKNKYYSRKCPKCKYGVLEPIYKDGKKYWACDECDYHYLF